MPEPKLNNKVLVSGTLRAVHVYVPALQDRLKNGGAQPVWAVRTKRDGFCRMSLYRKVEILGPCEGVEHFDHPLPGTNGRGVAPLYTMAAIRVYWDRGSRIKTLRFSPERMSKVGF